MVSKRGGNSYVGIGRRAYTKGQRVTAMRIASTHGKWHENHFKLTLVL
ncbi:hypothetical protein C3B79_3824 [Aeromonas hydrophila]|nr:hypothetical protein C3B79_3824 [Aeromonas hydrophila]